MIALAAPVSSDTMEKKKRKDKLHHDICPNPIISSQCFFYLNGPYTNFSHYSFLLFKFVALKKWDLKIKKNERKFEFSTSES